MGGCSAGRCARRASSRPARRREAQGRVAEEPPKPGAEPADEPGPLTRRGPLAGLLLRLTRPVTAMRRAPELAREHGTAPWRLFVARIAASPPIALVIAILAIAALAFAATNVSNMKLGLTFIASLPKQDEVRRAADAAQQGFAPGILAPTEVDLVQPGIGGRRPQLARLEQLIGREPGVAAVTGPSEQVPGAPADRGRRVTGRRRATRSSSTRTRSARPRSTASARCATTCRGSSGGPGWAAACSCRSAARRRSPTTRSRACSTTSSASRSS